MCVMPSKSTFDTNYVAQKYKYNDFTSFLKRSVLKLEQCLRHLWLAPLWFYTQSDRGK